MGGGDDWCVHMEVMVMVFQGLPLKNLPASLSAYNATTNQRLEQQRWAVVVAAMATATVAGTTAIMAAAAAVAAKTTAATAQKSKKEDKLERWRQILAEGEQPPAVWGWADEDKQRLLALSTSELGLADTCFWRELKRQKREMKAAIEHFHWEERIAIRRRLDKIDAKEVRKALEEAPTEEASAGEWQGEARGDSGGSYVNIILRNHVIVDNNHLGKKSRKKALWKVP